MIFSLDVTIPFGLNNSFIYILHVFFFFQAELALLMADEDDVNQKHHFDYEKIIKQESKIKPKKKVKAAKVKDHDDFKVSSSSSYLRFSLLTYCISKILLIWMDIYNFYT